jgi:hypothetical protein
VPARAGITLDQSVVSPKKKFTDTNLGSGVSNTLLKRD